MISCLLQTGYDFLWWAATPLLQRHLQKRVAIGKEDAARLCERFGVSSIPRPSGKLIWLHGASVGESVALLAIIARLRAESNPPAVLITTGTVTSAKIMQDRLPDGCIHQYLPLDRKLWVERFLDHWQPDGIIWSESEIWPGIFASIGHRRIPAVIVNVRLSAGTVKNWFLLRPWVRSLLSIFSVVAAQTAQDKDNWERLGGPKARLLGNLKFVVPELPFDAEKLAVLHGNVGNRPVWVFSSIHPGEELIGGRIHQQLKKTTDDLLTILIPRHPQRGDEFSGILRDQGLQVAQRSQGEEITPQTDVYLADTIGELGLFYRLSKIVAIGGSFVPHGGQNPIEPAKLEAAVIYGPYMFNFAGICTAFEAVRAVLPVRDESELQQNLTHFLAHPHDAAQLGKAAGAVAQGEAGSLDQLWLAIADWRSRVLG